MKVHEAEAILKYYADIPQRIEIIRRQCTALSDEVDPMRGMGTDGMPRGGTPGDSTAAETNCVSWNSSGRFCWEISVSSRDK